MLIGWTAVCGHNTRNQVLQIYIMKISIITPTYNSSATIQDTINSVLSQSFLDFEHIIVDGGSKDNTVDIIKESEPLYNGKLKWVSEPDKGIYDAMNKGIKMASGDIVGILNSDDFFSSPEVLSKINENILGLDAIYGDIHYVNPDDLSKPVRYYSSAGFNVKKMKMGFMPAHPSFYCRKEVFDKVGLFDTEFKVAADFEFLLRALYVNGIKTKYIPFDFVTMRTGGASTSGLSSHKRIFLDHMKAYRKNGVKSNAFLESLRYPSKILELLSFRFSNSSLHTEV